MKRQYTVMLNGGINLITENQQRAYARVGELMNLNHKSISILTEAKE